MDLHKKSPAWLANAPLVLFMLVFFSTMVFHEYSRHTSNYTSRFYLTRAIVDNGSFVITPFKSRLGYDQALYQGERMSNKPLARIIHEH